MSQICIITVILFFVFSIGTALAPNLPAYFVFRALSAFPGTSFLVVGSSSIGDVYEPTKRATALAWFLSGTVVGPAFGPFLGVRSRSFSITCHSPFPFTALPP